MIGADRDRWPSERKFKEDVIVTSDTVHNITHKYMLERRNNNRKKAKIKKKKKKRKELKKGIKMNITRIGRANVIINIICRRLINDQK